MLKKQRKHASFSSRLLPTMTTVWNVLACMSMLLNYIPTMGNTIAAICMPRTGTGLF